MKTLFYLCASLALLAIAAPTLIAIGLFVAWYFLGLPLPR